jgi:peptidoglycan/LPS O-acetylase OafA/YrhL
MVTTAAAAPAQTEPRVPTRRRANYRPHLDGLRAVAVYLVVAYHAGIGAFSGGFIGVDVFFVLSGYLVTLLLLRDLDVAKRITPARFYARRYRRLLPAAFVTLIVTAVAWMVVASASEVADAVGAFRASFLYYANWYFIRQSTDYFAADINTSPVIHFWSLAVEEQFYLVWPLLLGALFAVSRWFGRWRTSFVRLAVVALGLASVIAALHVSGYNLDRAYYGTDTRGYQLLAGAFLALTPRLFRLGARATRFGGAVAFGALAAIVLLGTSMFDMDAIHRGIATAIAAVALIVAIESFETASATRALSRPKLAYLGRLSYGTYLWHWPVIVVLTHEVSLGPFPVFAIACVLATALAALSYHVLELRIRFSPRLDRFPKQVIASGLAISLIGGLVLIPAILHTSGNSLDWQAAKNDIPALPDNCSLANTAGCILVHGTGPHILLLGDSNARMYIPTFESIARKNGYTLSVASAPLCPWQEGLVYYIIGDDACQPKHQDWYGGLVDKLHPDIVVLVDRPIDDMTNAAAITASGKAYKPDNKNFEKVLTNESASSIAKLEAPGRQLVVVEPIPIAAKDADPINCLSSTTDVSSCIYQANAQPTPLEDFYRAEAKQGAITASLDLDKLICPRLPACDPVVDGMIVKRDSNHITGAFAAHIADRVDQIMRRDGVLR